MVKTNNLLRFAFFFSVMVFGALMVTQAQAFNPDPDPDPESVTLQIKITSLKLAYDGNSVGKGKLYFQWSGRSRQYMGKYAGGLYQTSYTGNYMVGWCTKVANGYSTSFTSSIGGLPLSYTKTAYIWHDKLVGSDVVLLKLDITFDGKNFAYTTQKWTSATAGNSVNYGSGISAETLSTKGTEYMYDWNRYNDPETKLYTTVYNQVSLGIKTF